MGIQVSAPGSVQDPCSQAERHDLAEQLRQAWPSGRGQRGAASSVAGCLRLTPAPIRRAVLVHHPEHAVSLSFSTRDSLVTWLTSSFKTGGHRVTRFTLEQEQGLCFGVESSAVAGRGHCRAAGAGASSAGRLAQPQRPHREPGQQGGGRSPSRGC